MDDVARMQVIYSLEYLPYHTRGVSFCELPLVANSVE